VPKEDERALAEVSLPQPSGGRASRLYRLLRDKVKVGADGFARGDVRGAVGAVLGSGPSAGAAWPAFKTGLIALTTTLRAYEVLGRAGYDWIQPALARDAIGALRESSEALLVAARELLASYDAQWGDERRSWEGRLTRIKRLEVFAGTVAKGEGGEDSRAVFTEAMSHARALTAEATELSRLWESGKPG
jgi:hypothetical protein